MLNFDYEFDERTAEEARDRGYWGHSYVLGESGNRINLVFYDPTRLAQDLEEEVNQGRPFVFEDKLIVVPEVTRDFMEMAVCKLREEGRL